MLLLLESSSISGSVIIIIIIILKYIIICVTNKRYKEFLMYLIQNYPVMACTETQWRLGE